MAGKLTARAAVVLFAALVLSAPAVSAPSPEKVAAKQAKHAAKHARPAQLADTSAAAASSVRLDEATLTATGLEPGHVYCASFEFTPDPGFETTVDAFGVQHSTGFNLGYCGPRVNAAGTIEFPNEVSDVDPYGVPGTVRAWIHDGVAFESPAAEAPDGSPLVASGRLAPGV